VKAGGLARRDVLGLAAAASALVTGCAASAPGLAAAAGPAGPAADGTRRRPGWLLTRSALAHVAVNQPVAAELVRAGVYELLRPGQRPLALPGAVPAVAFTSAAALVRAVHAGALPAGTRAVLYDPEVWPFTPVREQRDPAGAAGRAATAAHAAGLQLIAAPALNLTSVLAPGRQAPRAELFLELGLAGRMAAHADMVELQAQSLERDAAGYASFVGSAARQARQARPRVGVLAGLSTNPPGGAVDAAQLVAAIRATRHIADGYWLNIPGPGPRCPTCNPAQPDTGIAALMAVL
jgi:hypothetical protein